MRNFTLPTRFAATGATAALIAASVALAPAATAAVSKTTSYDCGAAGPVSVTIAQSLISDGMTLSAGMDAPNLPLDISATLSDATTGALRSGGVTEVSGSSSDMVAGIAPAGSTTPIAQVALVGVNFPASPMPDSGAITINTVPSDGSQGFPAATDPFNGPPAGSYDVLLPSTFTFNAAMQGGGALPGSPYTCTLGQGEDPKLATLNFAKNPSTVKARVKNAPLHRGDRAKLAVRMVAANETPSGKVLVKMGRKTIGKGMLGSAGRVTIRLDRMSVGGHKIVIKYRGDGYTKASRKAMRVVVKR